MVHALGHNFLVYLGVRQLLSSLVLLVIQITLMILLEGFLVRLNIGKSYCKSLFQHNKYSHHGRHSLRKNTNNFIRVPELHEHRHCTGFTYCGAKIFNSLPIKTRETQDRNIFKTLVKEWIWDEVPSY